MNTANRILWTVIGLLLVAAGAGALASGFGWLRGVDPNQPVWPAAWSRWWQAHDQITVPALVVLAVIALVAGLALLRRQLRRRAEPTIASLYGEQVRDLTGRPSEHLTIRGRALSRGAAADLARHRHVSQASVALTGDPRTPTMDAHLEVTPQATVAALTRHVAASVHKLKTTLGIEPETRVLLSIDSGARQRVT